MVYEETMGVACLANADRAFGVDDPDLGTRTKDTAYKGSRLSSWLCAAVATLIYNKAAQGTLGGLFTNKIRGTYDIPTRKDVLTLNPINPKTRIPEIARILLPLWPDERPLLSFSGCFELLCAVILSAQCTDEQVNAVTPTLFAAYPDPASMARAEPAEVELLVHSVGFFRTKARHLVMTAQKIVTEHGGKVPSTMEKLLELPGVGRKTANLVISTCFGVPGIIVDTHVSRLVYRLGLHNSRAPDAIEKKIRENLKESSHTAFSHALNRHGKYICKARNPLCLSDPTACPLEALCPRIGL